MGPFGRAHAESLRENRPETYRALHRNGMLVSYLAALDREAQQMFESTVMEMLKANPPKGDSFLLRVQHVETIAQQARELMLDEVVVRETEADASTKG
jgi:hypothetical protein